jgi:hypothetical protein
MKNFIENFIEALAEAMGCLFFVILVVGIMGLGVVP